MNQEEIIARVLGADTAAPQGENAPASARVFDLANERTTASLAAVLGVKRDAEQDVTVASLAADLALPRGASQSQAAAAVADLHDPKGQFRAIAIADGAAAERERIFSIWDLPEAKGRLDTAIALSRSPISVETARACLRSLPAADAAPAAAGVTGNPLIDRAVKSGAMSAADGVFLMFGDHEAAEEAAIAARVLMA